MRFRLSVLGVILIVVVMSAQFQAAPGDVLAQEGEQCTQLISDALTEAQEACAGTARGEVCYAFAGTTATSSDNATFAAGGDKVTLASLESLITAAANPDTGEWGIATLMLPAGLPEGEQAVMGVLFGNAQITRPEQAASDRPTLTVTNSGSAEVNLRNGAGTTYSVVSVLAPGQSVVADGRNQESDWVRVQLEDGSVAWVFARVISWEGDLSTLEVLLPNDVTPPFQVGEPFQAFNLTTGGESALCGAAPSGLLLQYSGEEVAELQVNNVKLEFSDATLLLHSTPGETLEVLALAGSATVTARGIPQEVSTGRAVEVDLGGEDGLTPAAPPDVVGSYAFPSVANVPVSLLPGTMACLVGLADANADVTLRVGPGTQRGVLADMKPDTSYAAIGWANDPEGAPWWQLDTGAEKSWVAQSEVGVIGACDTVAEVEPPPLTFAAPAGGEGTTTVDDFSPATNTVWQMYPGSDNMSGECSGTSPINFCDHLAAISPASGGIMWKGMEASPYYLVQIQPNVYAYSGPNVLGTGTISITLRFASETEVTMTQSLVLSSEPDCRHVYNYTGTKNW